MKRAGALVIILSAVVIMAVSCSGNKKCPAYSKATVEQQAVKS